jgi:putative transposase
LSVSHRQSLVQRNHAQLSISRQCVLLQINRSSLYYAKRGESAFNLLLKQEIGRLFKLHRFFGVGSMRKELGRLGHAVNVKRVRRLMRKMSLKAENQKTG